MALDFGPPLLLDGGVEVLRARRVSSGLTVACCALACVLPPHPDRARAEPAAAPEAAQPAWQVIEKSGSVTVSKQEHEGGFPGFRGQGVVRGNVLRVLSLLLDVDAVPRWAYGVDEARMVKHPTERSDTVYLYSDVAWPVRDRDMIVRRTVEVLTPGQHFRIKLQCAPDEVPERSGVVRVRACESAFELSAQGASSTFVDYKMTLDPAGFLPKWAGAWVAKHVPTRTLESIEHEASEPACAERYEASMRRWSTAL
jgi:START domain